MPKGEWKEYFVFSKKERMAVFILLGIIAVFIFFMFWYTPVFTKPYIDAKVQQQLTALAAARHNAPVITDSLDDNDSSEVKPAYTAKRGETGELFYFDPNTLDTDGWKRLGFRDKTIENIQAYRKAHGNFKKPDDLYNVPRIRKKVVAAVLPYIKFGATGNQPAAPGKTQAVVTPAVAKQYKRININSAMAEDFKVFGVNDAVAVRIIKFRTKLNGFTSIDDVAKTYGLPDSTFKLMRPYLSLSAQ